MTDAAGFLLDTNAWFWMVTGDTRIPLALVATLEAAAAEGRVCVSQISAWEIALKESVGKLRLNVPITRWLEENTEGVRVLDLPLDVIVDATHLPGTFHKSARESRDSGLTPFEACAAGLQGPDRGRDPPPEPVLLVHPTGNARLLQGAEALGLATGSTCGSTAPATCG